MTNTPLTDSTDQHGTSDLVDALNGDLRLEFRSIVQDVQHVATITGAEYTSTVDELTIHLTQELRHATVLAERVVRCSPRRRSTFEICNRHSASSRSRATVKRLVR